MRKRTGSKWLYVPVWFDRANPPFGCAPGDVVKVITLPGCPRPGTMGMYHVAKDGKFCGHVCSNSLQSLKGGGENSHEVD
jgi:hypothetical protein